MSATNGKGASAPGLVKRAAAQAKPDTKIVRFVWGVAAGLVFLVLFPWLPFVSFSLIGRANLAAQYALIAMSLVVLTGWVGQVSLGQAAFVGIGAYTTGLAQEAWGIGFPLNLVAGAAFGALSAALLGMVALRVRGLYLAVATLIFSWTADAFLFQQDWLTKHSFISLEPLGDPGAYPFLDFTSRRTYYYAAWAAVILAVFLMANLRDRKIGRSFFAIRGSEMAAASLGIDVVRTKLMAFAVSGALAGVAGSLILVSSQVVVADQFSLSRSLFFLAIAVVGGLTSLPGAIASAILFAGLEEVFFRFPSIGEFLQLVSAVLLAAVLLLYPGGLAALGRLLADKTKVVARKLFPPEEAITDDTVEPIVVSDTEAETGAEGTRAETTPRSADGPRIPIPSFLAPLQRAFQRPIERYVAMREARQKVESAAVAIDFAAALQRDPDAQDPTPAPSANGRTDDGGDKDATEDEGLMSWEAVEIVEPEYDVTRRQERAALIEAEHVTVRFGGLTAVNDFSIAIRQGEIVGLIGPNGAGKTTTFNSIAGFNTPAEGRVRIHGVDVTQFPVHLRSRLGVARTFQAIQLFPQLNVFDNLLVATYLADQTGIFGCMFATNRSLREELKARRRVEEVVEILGLEDVAHRQVSGLPFGVLRMVEIARALVTGAPVIMLDEPASGLDDLETERLTRLVQFIRSLGVTILLIEHDVKMVTSISDYMYVIDQGTPIAEGTPDEIKRNPAVIAAYLGEETHDDAETDADNELESATA